MGEGNGVWVWVWCIGCYCLMELMWFDRCSLMWRLALDLTKSLVEL